jgi:rare lipoprotein A
VATEPDRRGARAAQASTALTVVLLALTGGLGACARSEGRPEARAVSRAHPAIAAPERPAIDPATGTRPSERALAEGHRIPKGGGTYKIGSPYRVAGRWYVPREEPGYDRAGMASWYGPGFHGRRTANGEIYDQDALTAAHPTLPIPSYAWVTNLANGRTLLVRINDRGPYAHDRIIDLSRAVARALSAEQQGVARVRVRYAGRAPLDGDDSRERRFLAAQPWSSPRHAAAGR